MKRITVILVLVLASFTLFADGDKVKNYDGLRYNPNPTTGDVGRALNTYIGVGYIGYTRLGVNLGLDYEIPVIDPNLTLGPGFKLGLNPYPYDYWTSTGHYVGTGLGTSILAGVSAHYYVDWLIPNIPDEFDVFITSNVGLGFIMYSSNSNEEVLWGENRTNSVLFDFGNAIGGRWNFSDNMSMYLQVGHGTSSVLFGLTFKM